MEQNNINLQLVALRCGEYQSENANYYWTEKDQQIAETMFREGYGISEIALALKRTEVSVVNYLQNKGLFAPQCRPRTRKEKSIAGCLCEKCQAKSCPRKDANQQVCPEYQPAI